MLSLSQKTIFFLVDCFINDILQKVCKHSFSSTFFLVFFFWLHCKKILEIVEKQKSRNKNALEFHYLGVATVKRLPCICLSGNFLSTARVTDLWNSKQPCGLRSPWFAVVLQAHRPHPPHHLRLCFLQPHIGGERSLETFVARLQVMFYLLILC